MGVPDWMRAELTRLKEQIMPTAKQSKRKKRKPTGKFHSSVDGTYKSKEYAAANPDKVVAETEVVEEENCQPAQEEG